MEAHSAYMGVSHNLTGMKSLLTYLVYISIVIQINAQNKGSEKLIQDIRTKYQNTLSNLGSYSYQKIELPNSNFDVFENDTIWHEGPIEHLEYYIDENELKLLVHISKSSEGYASTDIEQYFLDQSELYFIFIRRYSIAYEQSMESYLTEWRAYFNNGELVRLLKKEVEEKGGRNRLDSIANHVNNKEQEVSGGNWLSYELKRYLDVIKR